MQADVLPVAEIAAHRWVRRWEPDGADVYIGRPGPWGNPFRIGVHGDRSRVVERFGAWLAAQPHLQRLARRELAGKTLGCWCAPELCHGERLSDLANDGGPSEDPVFVFGSNEAGRHGRGAAAFAHEWRGAAMGVGRGPTGNAYAIPTKDEMLIPRSLAAIRASVTDFIAYTRAHAEQAFEVTRVGCGLAGYPDFQIAPMFEAAPPNVDLPHVWSVLLGRTTTPRVIVAGPRTFKDQDRADAALDNILARMASPVVISGAAKGADTLGEIYAARRWADRDVPFLRYPAEWDRYGKRRAGMYRNLQMARAASHLVAFWDGKSRGTRAMVDMAQDGGLTTRIVRIA